VSKHDIAISLDIDTFSPKKKVKKNLKCRKIHLLKAPGGPVAEIRISGENPDKTTFSETENL